PPTATTRIYTLSLHDALPICLELVVQEHEAAQCPGRFLGPAGLAEIVVRQAKLKPHRVAQLGPHAQRAGLDQRPNQVHAAAVEQDRKSTRLNSSHLVISYAVF